MLNGSPAAAASQSPASPICRHEFSTAGEIGWKFRRPCVRSTG